MKAPDRFGTYEVVQELEPTERCRRYAARDSRTSRNVVIKIPTSNRKTERERFMAVAIDAAKLDCQHVVRVLDVGTEGDVPFFVEEALDGETLAQRMKSEAASEIQDKLHFLETLSAGLAHVHSHGFTRVGPRPETVWWTDEASAKLGDVETARLEPERGGGATMVGATVAFTGYEAPEQFRGEALDQRADVFAFGAIAYELLGSSPAFARDNVTETIRALLETDPPPLTETCPDCPKPLADLLAECLSKEPDARPTDFESISAQLSSLVEEAGESSSRSKPASRATVMLTQEEVEKALADEVSAPKAGSTMLLTSDQVDEALKAAEKPRPTEEKAPAKAPDSAPKRSGALTTVINRASEALSSALSLARRHVRVVAISGAVLMAIVIAVVFFARSSSQSRAPLPIDSVKPVSEEGVEAGHPVGAVLVDARPWAELVRITDSSAQDVTLPAVRATPLRLELPGGAYELTLTHPSFPEPKTCAVEVAVNQTSSCDVDFATVDAVEFLTRRARP
jgi:serine/threonine protein kinase